MDEAIIEVEALIKRLNKFELNFKKCSRANRTKGYLEGRLTGLNELWNKVCEADEKIESLKTDVDENESYFEDDKFGMLEEAYYRLIGEIKDQLAVLNPQPQVVVNQNANANQDNHQRNDQSKVKLPKISLPTFAGSYHTWLSFKNRFTNLIHNSTSLSNVEKLEYLKSCVTGDADRTIQRFQITDQNYTAAWDRLNEKYDNKRILQDTQIETIIDRKEIKVETSKELRELLDVVQESLEELKNMQVNVASWDPILVVLIKRKLPFKTREEWEKELDPVDVPTYAQLIAFLEKRFRTVESLELVVGVTSETGYQNQTLYHKGKPNHRGNCLVCNNASHSLMICDKFRNMTVGSRTDFVNANRICRNCLAIGHVFKDCNSSKRCFKCNSSHHTLLHIEDQNSSQEPSYNRQSNSNYSSNYHQNSKSQSQTYVTNTQQNRGAQAQTQSTQYVEPSQQTQHNLNPLNPNAPPYANLNQSRTLVTKSNWTPPVQHIHPSHQTHSPQSYHATQSAQQKRTYTTTTVHHPVQSIINPRYNQISENETLFPTAIVKIKSADGKIMNLRALLDQCSGEVYIKESVAKMLGAKQVSISPFEVTGLEDVVTSKVDKATHVKMIIDKTESLDLKANIVKTLVGILPQSIVKWPEHLFKNIKLADTNFATPNNVDIMLGTEVYTQILLEGVLKEGGYLAQNTKLGWIISGKSDEIMQQPKQASICGFTRKKVEVNEEMKSWSESSRRYYAPQRNSNPVYLSDSNRKIVKSEKHHEVELTNHTNCLPPRLSLINVNVNRLRKADQIAKIVNNFENRWKSGIGLASTSMLTRPIPESNIFAMMKAAPNITPEK